MECGDISDPPTITGSPTHKVLKRLKKELQANSSSIETDLGGVKNGRLGLTTTDEEHSTISNTQSFDPPTCSPPLGAPLTAKEFKFL